MLTVISMQANIPIELAVRYMYGDKSDDTTYPLSIDMSTLIDSQFSAATLLITFGALIGRVSPLQMSVLTLCEAFFYAFNKVFLVLGIIGAEDVGGTMTIHMFGAYFGLAVSYALDRVPKLETCEPDKVSLLKNIFSYFNVHFTLFSLIQSNSIPFITRFLTY